MLVQFKEPKGAGGTPFTDAISKSVRSKQTTQYPSMSSYFGSPDQENTPALSEYVVCAMIQRGPV